MRPVAVRMVWQVARAVDVPVIGMGTWRTFDVSGERLETACCSIVDGALSSGSGFFDAVRQVAFLRQMKHDSPRAAAHIQNAAAASHPAGIQHVHQRPRHGALRPAHAAAR